MDNFIWHNIYTTTKIRQQLISLVRFLQPLQIIIDNCFCQKRNHTILFFTHSGGYIEKDYLFLSIVIMKITMTNTFKNVHHYIVQLNRGQKKKIETKSYP